MTARWSLLAAGALFLLAIVVLVWLPGGQRGSDPQVVAFGSELYTLHCAGCHGTNLKGQPNWQVALSDGKMPAPPLDETGHAPHHADAQLVQIVKEGIVSVTGGKPTDMPAFEGVLSDEEIGAVMAFIKSHW